MDFHGRWLKWRGLVPFGGFVDTAPRLAGQIPQNPILVALIGDITT